MSKFDIEKFVLENIRGLSILEAHKFAKAHGYTIRVVKIWKRGKWSPLICTQDYIKSRINIGEHEDEVDCVEGLG